MLVEHPAVPPGHLGILKMEIAKWITKSVNHLGAKVLKKDLEMILRFQRFQKFCLFKCVLANYLFTTAHDSKWDI